MDLNYIVDSPLESFSNELADHTALVIGAESWTYAELQRRRNQWVNILLDNGVERGDRVGLLLENTLDYIAAHFAITRLGAISVRLNFRLSAPEIEYIVNDSGCTTIITQPSYAVQLDPIRDSVPVEHWLVLHQDQQEVPEWAQLVDPGNASDTVADLPSPAGADPLMLMYTSGTTGRPKGVVWTHDNAVWIGASQTMRWKLDRNSVTMTTGPLYHSGAFEILVLPALLSGGTAVMMPSGGITTEAIVDTIEKNGVTHVLLYPFLLYGILEQPDTYGPKLSSLQLILAGGDPVLPSALTAAEKSFPHLEVQQGYGLTEATMTSTIDHKDLHKHPDSVGKPMPLARIKVMIDNDTPAAPDEVGEVWLSSPVASIGYWNNPTATAETYVDGWVKTGDLGRMTPDGFLVLEGRKKDMIRSGGENIYPAEVDAALSAHPYVSSITVVAVPDEKYVEVGCAVVVASEDARELDPTVIEEELRKFARTVLAGYKCPKHYTFRPNLPMNASGKILKHQLRDEYAHLGSSVAGKFS